MKLAGREIKGANVELIVIPRHDENIILKAQAVLSYADFEALCPMPIPPTIIRKGGVATKNVEDPNYREQLQLFASRRVAWLIVTSLRLGTPELEWDQVSFGDPTTWPKYEDELKESGFSHAEIQEIVNGVMAANCLDESRIDEARSSFLASQAAETAELLSSRQAGVENLQSGKPV